MKRLLVVELHHLGDAVLALPFLRAAMRQWDVVFCASPPAAALFAHCGWAERVVVSPGAKPWREQETLRRLRSLRAEVAVCAWPDARVAGLLRVLGIPRRVGFPMTAANYFTPEAALAPDRRWIGCAMECLGARPNEPLYQVGRRRRRLLDWERMAAHLGMEADYGVPWLPAPPRLQPPGICTWGVHPGARVPEKRWARGHFQQILARLADAGRTVVVLDDGEGMRLDPAGAGQRTVLCRDLGSLVDALAGVDCLLAHDSAPAHLAAALGRRVVTLFGAMLPDWFAPWHQEAGVVHVPGQWPLRRDVLRRRGASLLDGVDPDLVWTRMLEIERSAIAHPPACR